MSQVLTMNKAILAIASLAALLVAAAPHSAALEPPAGSFCPIGYNPDALANLCIIAPDTVFPSREACFAGDVCIDIPVILEEDGQAPLVLYFDAMCALPEFQCGCSHAADGLVYSCTHLQSNGEFDGTNPDEAGYFEDTPTVFGEVDDALCLPFAYQEAAFANICIMLEPEWGSGLGPSSDVLCAVGDACIFTPVTLTDEDGIQYPAAVYADALCNLPSGCGCGYFAQRLLMLCSPLQS